MLRFWACWDSLRLQNTGRRLADYICRIRRIRKKLGIICRQKKKFKATTCSGHNLPVAGNILDQQFDVDAPNKVWVSDITYIPTDEGWLYLAFYVSYYCALAGVSAHKHVDSLVESFFQTIYSGNFNISHSEILNSILEDVDEERNTNDSHA